MTSAPTVARAAWILIRLRLRRVANGLPSLFRPSPVAGKRTATAPKPSGKRAAVLAGILTVILAFVSSAVVLSRLDNTVGPAAWARGAGLVASLGAVLGLFLSVTSRELARPEWDLEWLVTLPLPTRSLLIVRILERAAVSPTAFAILFPFLTTVAIYRGWRLLSPIAGLLLAIPLFLMIGVVHTIIDTGLRQMLTPPRLRNLQAVLSVATIILLYLLVGPRTTVPILAEWGLFFPSWLEFHPGALAVYALSPRVDAVHALWAVGLLFVQAAAVLAGGMVLLTAMLRRGVVAASPRETGRGERAPVAEAPPTVAGPDAARGRRFPTALQIRELRLLARDRAYMVQTIVAPLLLIGFQIYNNIEGGLIDALRSPNHLAALAFGAAVYMVGFSAVRTVGTEGQALWILFTFPRALTSMLFEKTVIFALFGTALAAAIFAVGLARGAPPDALALGAFAVAGIPIYATIGTSLGVFAFNTNAQDEHQRVRPMYIQLYLLFGAFYVAAIYAPSWWQRVTMLVLTGLLALALWQEARDQLPFLLDPDATPPPRVSLSDGLVATIAFFVLQGVVFRVVEIAVDDPGWAYVVLAYAIAGLVTCAIGALVLRLTSSSGLPRFIPERWLPALATGATAGLAAATFGVACVLLYGWMGWFAPPESAPAIAPATPVWIFVLAVAAAPPVEEWLFRGLVFGGLRRSFGVVAAAFASAAIFAIVHPPATWAPGFVLGLCAAGAYARTGSLVAPILAHAIYNTAVLLVRFS